jgi:uncharacterized phage protein (TIGR02220 family)
MRQFIIPESFFKTLAEMPKLYSRLWFEWLSGYADDIFEPNFLEKLDLTFYSENDVREIHTFGVQLLRQGDFSIIDKSKGRKKVSKKIDPELQQVVNKVVEYLNSKAETSFLPHTQSTIELVVGRIKEGYTISDFVIVIDNKVSCRRQRSAVYRLVARSETLSQRRPRLPRLSRLSLRSV